MRPPRRPRRRALVALVLPLLLAASGASLGDVVTTRDGKTYEGRVVRQDDAEVVVETTFQGTVTLPRASVRAIDTSVPPLREQLRFRLDQAGEDPAALWAVHGWAKGKGFSEELQDVLGRIVAAKPDDARARKLLGHEKVDGRWMTPEEKERHLAAQHEAEMRAKGLVPYEGRWVTPEEKDALERGLRKDGDEWVTEEEYHRRRGERLVDGKWVRVGEEEARAWAAKAAAGARVELQVLWGPHFDVFHDVEAETAEEVLAAAEKAFAAMRSVLRPEGNEYPETLGERIQVVLFAKVPAYARFATWFDQEARCSELIPGWGRAVQKQHSFWWADPEKTTAVYRFPNVNRTFVSNAIHNVGLILLTRYRFNYRFPHTWLREGFAYYLEMEALGYSDSFTLGRGGTAAAADARPALSDSDKWRSALQGLVNEGSDPPLKRLASMETDQMGYEELVKSWSVVECLVRWDPKRFKAFVDSFKARDKTEEEALREAYGVGYRELDERWRAYVQAGFRHP